MRRVYETYCPASGLSPPPTSILVVSSCYQCPKVGSVMGFTLFSRSAWHRGCKQPGAMKPSSSVPTNPNTDDCNMGSIPPLNTPTPGVSKHVRGVGKKTLGSFADDLATGGVLSNEDVKQAVDKAIASCGTSPEPSLFAMEDMEVVGETTFSLLRSSPVLNVLLPHIKRVVEAEHVSSARGGFVARTFRGRPGSVYAVRWLKISTCFMVR